MRSTEDKSEFNETGIGAKNNPGDELVRKRWGHIVLSKSPHSHFMEKRGYGFALHMLFWVFYCFHGDLRYSVCFLWPSRHTPTKHRHDNDDDDDGPERSDSTAGNFCVKCGTPLCYEPSTKLWSSLSLSGARSPALSSSSDSRISAWYTAYSSSLGILNVTPTAKHTTPAAMM